jgi:hypothetical protein
MKTLMGVLIIVASSVAISSCGLTKDSRATEAATTDFQRFVPIPTVTPLFEGVQPGNLALDTKTGSLCKTWGWNLASSALNGLPECQMVYATYAKDH